MTDVWFITFALKIKNETQYFSKNLNIEINNSVKTYNNPEYAKISDDNEKKIIICLPNW